MRRSRITRSSMRRGDDGGGGNGSTYLPPNCLSFPGNAGAHVNHGYVWPFGSVSRPGGYGPFFWETMVAPASGAQYMISDGYGGSHALLWGFSGGSPSLSVTGNLWNGAVSTSFSGRDLTEVGEWCLKSLAWDGANIYGYTNGIPDFVVPFAGPRTNVDGGGTGILYYGGSDHSQYAGKSLFVRGWDDFFTAFQPGVSSYYPQRRPLTWAGFNVPVEFLADYSNEQTVISDKSPNGCRGNLHPGTIITESNSSAGLAGIASKIKFEAPCPTFVYDATIALFLKTDTAPVNIYCGEPIQTPGAVPLGAIIYDSFSRPNQSYFNCSEPSLGTTEGGSAGPQTWVGRSITVSAPGGVNSMFGIQRGIAVSLESVSGAFAVIFPTIGGTGNVRVEATRSLGPFALAGQISLTWRFKDLNNYWGAFVQNDPAGNHFLYIRCVVAGAVVVSANFNIGAAGTTWTKLAVNHNSSLNEVKVFVDGVQAAGSTTITGANQLASEIGVGITNFIVSGVDCTQRWVDFATFTAT